MSIPILIEVSLEGKYEQLNSCEFTGGKRKVLRPVVVVYNGSYQDSKGSAWGANFTAQDKLQHSWNLWASVIGFTEVKKGGIGFSCTTFWKKQNYRGSTKIRCGQVSWGWGRREKERMNR